MANFGLPFNNFAGQIHSNYPQQSQQFYPQQNISLPSGKNDLEVLENLKTMIKTGQHEYFRAVPQPAALASLYLGPSQPNSSTPDVLPPPTLSPRPGPSTPTDYGRRPPRLQKDAWDGSRKSLVSPSTNGTPIAATSKQSVDGLTGSPLPAIKSEVDSKTAAEDASRTRDPSWLPKDHELRRDSDPTDARSVRDARYYDTRDRDRDRERDWERDRDRRHDERRQTDRHYEPTYDRAAPRRYDPRDERLPPAPSDSRAPPRSTHLDDRLPLVDDRLSHRPPPPAESLSDNAHSVVRSSSTSDVRPVSTADDRRVPPLSAGPSEGRTLDDHSRAPPSITATAAPSSEDRNGTRSQIPLEERISRAPSLQERLKLPVKSERSLEERISRAPATPVESRTALITDDKVSRSSAAVSRGSGISDPPPRSVSAHDERESNGHPPLSRGSDRYIPASARPSSYSASRADSVPLREETRPSKITSTPPRNETYTRPRELSRERVDPLRGANSYRPDDRTYDIQRRGHADYRGFSPPSAADIARDRERARNFASSPPRTTVEPVYADDRDRRYATREYYPDRRDDDVAYRPRVDRERYDTRDAPVAARWEDRDKRPYPSRSPSRVLAPSRISDYPPPPTASVSAHLDDRTYPPVRDDRARYTPAVPASPPTYSRVRARSPSPIRRPVVDDRPPVKRTREDAYASDYYPPRNDVRYPPPRAVSPSPVAGGSYYPSADRDYKRDYPSYDRPRSPARSSYVAGRYADPRDDRRYLAPPRP